MESDRFDGYAPESYVPAVERIVHEARPDVILFAADLLGAALAPRLAYRLSTGLVTDCVSVSRSAEGEIVFARPIYGGAMLAEMTVAQSPAIATITQHRLNTPTREGARLLELIRMEAPAPLGPARVRVVGVSSQRPVGPDLEDARIVVSVGRGLKGAEHLKAVEDLAHVLGGTLGSSRMAIESGWMPPLTKIGDTGKTVSPDLYIAIGISGANQHISGIEGAKHVVAINTNPAANIFSIAEVGIIADHREFVPLLTKEVAALLDQP
jgi:electron transfer flavoprotein alpha subunit